MRRKGGTTKERPRTSVTERPEHRKTRPAADYMVYFFPAPIAIDMPACRRLLRIGGFVPPHPRAALTGPWRGHSWGVRGRHRARGHRK